MAPRGRWTERLRRALYRRYEAAQNGVWSAPWSTRAIARLNRDERVGFTEHDVVVPVPAGSVEAAMPPLRIAFASDLHAGPLTPPRLLREACALLAGARADLLLLGGDLVSFRPEYADPLVPLLAAVPAPAGRFAVLGNHDHYAGADAVRRRLADAGVATLDNRAVRLPAPWSGVHVCGVDDPGSGRPDADAALAGADGVRVVLVHSPEGVATLAGRRWELMLCGHIHGGQVALPGGRLLIAPGGKLGRRYPRGRFAIPGGGTLLVSLGVGHSGLPFRTHAPPEIMVVTLRFDASAPLPPPH